MSFDYAASGLPEKSEWRAATKMCNTWLNKNMKAFGPERIANFMKNQPVAAANRVMENCDDWSEESVTLLLLGPAKGALLGSAEVEALSRRAFGGRAVDLFRAMTRPGASPDEAMMRDIQRIYLAEAISSMTDQMIGRHLFDKEGSRLMHHDTRKKMLAEFKNNFTQIKGLDPKLDAIFEDAAAQSQLALDAVDREISAKKKSLKPPSF